MLQALKDVFFVDEIKARQNISICKACISHRNDTLLGFKVMTCGTYMKPTDYTCGCVVDGGKHPLGALAKTRLNGFECPQKKWSNKNNQNLIYK